MKRYLLAALSFIFVAGTAHATWPSYNTTNTDLGVTMVYPGYSQPADIGVINDDFTNVVGFLVRHTNDVHNATNNIQSQISALEGGTNNLQAQVTELQGATNNLQVQVTDLKNSTNNLQVQVTDLKASTNNIQSQVLALQSQLPVVSNIAEYASNTAAYASNYIVLSGYENMGTKTNWANAVVDGDLNGNQKGTTNWALVTADEFQGGGSGITGVIADDVDEGVTNSMRSAFSNDFVSVLGDTINYLYATNYLQAGTGTTVATVGAIRIGESTSTNQGIWFGDDAYIYRSSAGVLSAPAYSASAYYSSVYYGLFAGDTIFQHIGANNRQWIWRNQAGFTSTNYMTLTNNAGIGQLEVGNVLATNRLLVGASGGYGDLVVLSGQSSAYPVPATVGTVPSGNVFGFSGDSILYGFYGGVNSSGNTWLQAGRSDGTHTAYNIVMQTGGGNVGIGTNNPATKLDVNGASTFRGDANFAGNSITNTGNVALTNRLYIGSPLDSYLRRTGTGTIVGNATIGADTSMYTPLYYGGYLDDCRIRLFGSDTKAIRFLNSSGAEWMVITNGSVNMALSGGNVGIGKVGANKLDVALSGTYGINSYLSGTTWGWTLNGSGLDLATIWANGGTGEIRIGSKYPSYFLTLYSGSNEAIRITTARDVGIGTASPATKLDVNGKTTMRDSLAFTSNRVCIGTNVIPERLAANLTEYMVGVGNNAWAGGVTNSQNSVAIGDQAGSLSANSASSVFVGDVAGYNCYSAPRTIGIGYAAAYAGLGGADCIYIGNYAGYFNYFGSYSIGIGNGVLQSANGAAYNTAIGYNAMYGVGPNSDANVAIGFGAMTTATNMLYTVSLGNSSGSFADNGVGNIMIGANANVADGSTNRIAIGYGCTNNVANNSVLIGNAGNKYLYADGTKVEAASFIATNSLCEADFYQYGTQTFAATTWTHITNWQINVCHANYTATDSNVLVAAAGTYRAYMSASFSTDTGAAEMECYLYTNNAPYLTTSGNKVGWDRSVSASSVDSVVSAEKLITIPANTYVSWRIECAAQEDLVWKHGTVGLERK